jgi:hypothetical protein
VYAGDFHFFELLGAGIQYVMEVTDRKLKAPKIVFSAIDDVFSGRGVVPVRYPSPANRLGGPMCRSVLASFLLLALPLATRADVLVLSDVKAQGGVQLSVDELRQLMPGASVVNLTESGNTRRWSNDADGTFIASSDNRFGSKKGRPTQAHGTWHVGDNGTYCVTMEWVTVSENWCRYIFKLGEKYYGVRSLADGTTKVLEFEFSK